MESLITSELMSGERVIWTGRPDTNILFTPSDIFLVPFSLVWAGFVVSMFFGILTQAERPPLPFFVIPAFFCLMGIYLVIGRFIVNHYRKKKTWFVLTDRRILIISNFVRKKIQSSFLSNLAAINKRASSKGRGTIKFGNENLLASFHANTGLDILGMYGESVPTFFDIAEVDKVFKLVCDLRDKANVCI